MPCQNDDGMLYDDDQEGSLLEAHEQASSITPGERHSWTTKGKTAAHLLRLARKAVMFSRSFFERTIFILSFITLCTGIVAFGRFFVSILTSHI